jgi:3-hydroxyacyl-[acyl-carrier-protein] dehydratase
MKIIYKPLYQSLRQSCLEWEVIRDEFELKELRAVFVFNAAYSGFGGHFPGRPILPAIVQLASVRFLAELGLKQSVYPVSYSRVKFRGIIQPDERIEVQLQMVKKEAAWVGSFSLHNSGEERVASGDCAYSIMRKRGR